MNSRWLCLITLLSPSVYATEYMLGDSCSVGDIAFTVENVGEEFIEVKSANSSMTLGTTVMDRICNETKMQDMYLRRILWVGKL
jgi:hypothetical protein